VTRVRLPFIAACLLLALPAGAAGPSTGGRPPDDDKLEAAADNIARMKAALKTVVGRAEQARNEKDVVKLNCVNEKLTQVKALLRVAEQADVALRESLARRAAGEAEFSKVAITRTKVDRLRREAEECIGQLAYMVDEKTTVEVEQPAGLPGPDEAGLGVATRTENPADLVSRIGTDDQGRRGPPFDPPPIIRPPAASRYLP
jgi:hypothetical protein